MVGMTSPNRVRATCEKLSTSMQCLKSLPNKTEAGAGLACFFGACAFAAGKHTVSVLNSSEWEKEVAPALLFSSPLFSGGRGRGGSLCSAQISVEYSGKFQSINHMAAHNNRLLYSASHSEIQSASTTVKWAAGWAKDKRCMASLPFLFSTPRQIIYTRIQLLSTYTCWAKT